MSQDLGIPESVEFKEIFSPNLFQVNVFRINGSDENPNFTKEQNPPKTSSKIKKETIPNYNQNETLLFKTLEKRDGRKFQDVLDSEKKEKRDVEEQDALEKKEVVSVDEMSNDQDLNVSGRNSPSNVIDKKVQNGSVGGKTEIFEEKENKTLEESPREVPPELIADELGFTDTLSKLHEESENSKISFEHNLVSNLAIPQQVTRKRFAKSLNFGRNGKLIDNEKYKRNHHSPQENSENDPIFIAAMEKMKRENENLKRLVMEKEFQLQEERDRFQDALEKAEQENDRIQLENQVKEIITRQEELSDKIERGSAKELIDHLRTFSKVSPDIDIVIDEIEEEGGCECEFHETPREIFVQEKIENLKHERKEKRKVDRKVKVKGRKKMRNEKIELKEEVTSNPIKNEFVENEVLEMDFSKKTTVPKNPKIETKRKKKFEIEEQLELRFQQGVRKGSGDILKDRYSNCSDDSEEDIIIDDFNEKLTKNDKFEMESSFPRVFSEPNSTHTTPRLKLENDIGNDKYPRVESPGSPIEKESMGIVMKEPKKFPKVKSPVSPKKKKELSVEIEQTKFPEVITSPISPKRKKETPVEMSEKIINNQREKEVEVEVVKNEEIKYGVITIDVSDITSPGSPDGKSLQRARNKKLEFRKKKKIKQLEDRRKFRTQSRQQERKKVKASKSNIQLIKLALNHVCLAGKVNETEKMEVLAVLEKESANFIQYLLYVKNEKTPMYRGLYGCVDYNSFTRIHGRGAKKLRIGNVKTFLSFDCGSKKFKIQYSKDIGMRTDGVVFKVLKKKRKHQKK